MSAAGPERHWSGLFDAAAAARSAEPAWLAAARKAALARFAELGFPTRRHEEWRYTNPAAIGRVAWREAAPASLAPGALDALGLPLSAGARLVFVNGHFARELSSPAPLPPGIVLESFGSLLAAEPAVLEALAGGDDPLADRALAQLARAVGCDGAFLRIARDRDVETPILLLFLDLPGDRPAAAHPRFAVVAEQGSRATLYELHATLAAGAHFTNALGELHVGENAELRHLKLALAGPDALHVAHTAARVARSGRLASTLVSLGGRVARHDVVVVLDAEGAECDLDGLFVAIGGEHVDVRTTVDHRKPHGTSREWVKGVLSGKSRGIFSGKVIVRPDAQRTDASQKNDNLLLSGDAEVDSKPQLEIEADDVKCSHGSTIGQLDEDAIFYLRSRGLDAAAASALLTRGFAAQITERIASAALRERVEERILARLFGESRP